MVSESILSLTAYDTKIFAVGQALQGMGVWLGYAPFERPVPADQDFFSAMATYSPERQPAANEIALVGWVDTDLMLRGRQAAAPCPTRRSFMTTCGPSTPTMPAGCWPPPST